MKEILFGKTLSEISDITIGMGMPRFTAKQITSWLYQKRASSFDDMTDISIRNRELLSERFEIGLKTPVNEAVSKDGTKKYLFPTSGGSPVESAYIPDKERATLCVSSQAGCRMGCLFCMTGKQGLTHSLTAGDILNQIRSIPESENLTNVVYMGMGEPFDNIDEVLKSIEILASDWGYGWSPTRITVSTVGLIKPMERFLNESKAHLAVSLHNPFHDQRKEIMPVEKAVTAESVVELLRKYDFSGQRRVSFEYIVFEGMNDSPAHVKELAKLLNGLKCRINLIRFHAIPGSQFKSPGEDIMVRFRDALTKKGITTTIRASRGEDIQAACGLLSTQNK